MTPSEIHRQNISDMQRALTFVDSIINAAYEAQKKEKGDLGAVISGLTVVQHACKAVRNRAKAVLGEKE